MLTTPHVIQDVGRRLAGERRVLSLPLPRARARAHGASIPLSFYSFFTHAFLLFPFSLASSYASKGMTWRSQSFFGVALAFLMRPTVLVAPPPGNVVGRHRSFPSSFDDMILGSSRLLTFVRRLRQRLGRQSFLSVALVFLMRLTVLVAAPLGNVLAGLVQSLWHSSCTLVDVVAHALVALSGVAFVYLMRPDGTGHGLTGQGAERVCVVPSFRVVSTNS